MMMNQATPQTETLPCYQGKNGKAAEYRTFRTPATIAEMQTHCDTHSHIWVRSLQGDARTCKVNGKVRRWKRDPSRIEVPVKYGLYEYLTLDASDISRVLIEVSNA